MTQKTFYSQQVCGRTPILMREQRRRGVDEMHLDTVELLGMDELPPKTLRDGVTRGVMDRDSHSDYPITAID